MDIRVDKHKDVAGCYSLSGLLVSPDNTEVAQVSFPITVFHTSNGDWYAQIDGIGYYALNYDEDFDPHAPRAWIATWASRYWSGKKASWELTSMHIHDWTAALKDTCEYLA